MYGRVLLKISGEALGAEKSSFDQTTVGSVCAVIKRCVAEGFQVAVVVGGGNIWRGAKGGTLERGLADHMGMLATVINSLALAGTLNSIDCPAVVQTAFPIGGGVTEPFSRAKADEHLKAGRVVLFAGGVGSPFFSTDTGAVLRAIEISADVLLCAKNIDGVYDRDPNKFDDAKKLDEISYDDALSQNLRVIDSTAFALGRDNKLPLYVFALSDPENIYRAVRGENIGSKIYC
jgi:uridylate kinase